MTADELAIFNADHAEMDVERFHKLVHLIYHVTIPAPSAK